MSRLFVVVEGDSEERFVRGTLLRHFPHLHPVAIKVETGRDAEGGVHRGGGDWTKWLADIRRTLGSPGDRVVTTMFDLYGLPRNFPGRQSESRISDTVAYADALEARMHAAVGDSRFMANVVRHEFETLVLAALPELQSLLAPTERVRLEPLKALALEAGPEEINCGRNTAPSKRLQEARLSYSKLSHGVPAVQLAGIAKLSQSCPRFRAWIEKLGKI